MIRRRLPREQAPARTYNANGPECAREESIVDTEQSADEPIAWHEITELTGGQKKWKLALYPDCFLLASPEGEPQQIDRDELPELVQVMDSGLFLRQVLAVTLDKKKVIFKLTPEVFAEVS